MVLSVIAAIKLHRVDKCISSWSYKVYCGNAIDVIIFFLRLGFKVEASTSHETSSSSRDAGDRCGQWWKDAMDYGS